MLDAPMVPGLDEGLDRRKESWAIRAVSVGNGAYTYSQLGGCGTAGLPGGTTGTVASGYRLLKVAGSAINETYATDANGSMTVATSTTGTVLRGWNYAAQGCANDAGAGCAGATDTQNRAVEVFKGATPAAATLRTRWDYDASERSERAQGQVLQSRTSVIVLKNVETSADRTGRWAVSRHLAGWPAGGYLRR